MMNENTPEKPTSCPKCGAAEFQPYYPQGVSRGKHWLCRKCAWSSFSEPEQQSSGTAGQGPAATQVKSAKAWVADYSQSGAFDAVESIEQAENIVTEIQIDAIEPVAAALELLKEEAFAAHAMCDEFKIARQNLAGRPMTLPERVNVFLEAVRNYDVWIEQAERIIGHPLPIAEEDEARMLQRVETPAPAREPKISLPHWIAESRLSLAEIGALACCAAAALHETLPDTLAVRMRSGDIQNAMRGLRAKRVLVMKEGGAMVLSLAAARHPKDHVEPPPAIAEG